LALTTYTCFGSATISGPRTCAIHGSREDVGSRRQHGTQLGSGAREELVRGAAHGAAVGPVLLGSGGQPHSGCAARTAGGCAQQLEAGSAPPQPRVAAVAVVVVVVVLVVVCRGVPARHVINILLPSHLHAMRRGSRSMSAPSRPRSSTCRGARRAATNKGPASARGGGPGARVGAPAPAAVAHPAAC
jgi:hypothetical protein